MEAAYVVYREYRVHPLLWWVGVQEGAGKTVEYSGVRSPLEYRIPLGGKGLSILVFFGGLITSQGGLGVQCAGGAHCNTVVMDYVGLQGRQCRLLGTLVIL